MSGIAQILNATTKTELASRFADVFETSQHSGSDDSCQVFSGAMFAQVGSLKSHMSNSYMAAKRPALTLGWKTEPCRARTTLLTGMRTCPTAPGNKKVVDMNDRKVEQELLAMPITELAKAFA